MYNTNNPVGTLGSADPRDLSDNSQVLDLLMNSSSDVAVSRLGAKLLPYSYLVKRMESGGGALAFANASDLKATKPSASNTLALDTSTGIIICGMEPHGFWQHISHMKK